MGGISRNLVVGAVLVVVILGVILLNSVIFVPHPAQPQQGLQTTTSQGTAMVTSSPSAHASSANQTIDTRTITQKGAALAHFIDSMNVTQHWLSGTGGINWSTGDPDLYRPVYSTRVTHCSNFVTAASLRLGVYLLRPPEHDQDNLVNAQNDWLNGNAGKEAGWTQLSDAISAQYNANQGNFVVSSTKGTDPGSGNYETVFGHIAIVRPSAKSSDAILETGPQVAEAGWINSPDVSVKAGYVSIPGAWVGDGKGAVQFFMHTIPDSALASNY